MNKSATDERLAFKGAKCEEIVREAICHSDDSLDKTVSDIPRPQEAALWALDITGNTAVDYLS